MLDVSTKPERKWKRCILIDSHIQQGNLSDTVESMVDTGGDQMAYISNAYAQELNLKLTPMETEMDIYGFDGKRVVAGRITHTANLTHAYRTITEELKLFVTTLGNYKIILGFPWMQKHRLQLDWRNERLLRPDELRRNSSPCQGGGDLPPEYLAERRARHSRNRDTIRTTSTDLRIIGAAPFAQMSTREGYTLFAATMRDIEKALAEKTYTDPATKVPKEFHNRLRVFSRQEADKLPEQRPYNHHIELLEG